MAIEQLINYPISKQDRIKLNVDVIVYAGLILLNWNIIQESWRNVLKYGLLLENGMKLKTKKLMTYRFFFKTSITMQVSFERLLFNIFFNKFLKCFY